MSALLEVVLPVFIVIGFGYVMVWRGLFSEEGVDLLMKFSQGIAIPALLFLAIARLDLSQDFHFPLLLSYYSGSILVFLLGMFGARVIFGRVWTDAVAIGFVAMFANSVLLGLPIMERAYGPDSLAGNYAIVALHAPFCYLVGVTAMEGVKAGRVAPHILALAVGRALSRNALTLAIGAGFVVNFIGLGMPVVVEDGIALLARAALPTALFGLGGVLYRYRPEGEVRVIAMVLILSLIVHPAIGWMMGSQILHIPSDDLKSVVITAAMAPGANAYLFANMYGAGRRVAASSVLVGTGVTVLTSSIWLIILG